MYLAVTGALFLGGAGSVIVGGLHWNRGTTAGAFASLIVGCITAVGGIVLPAEWFRLVPHLIQWYPAHATYLQAHAAQFPINGQYINAISMGLAILTYVGVSLATARQPFDMMRMLHRGRWAVDAQGNSAPAPEPPPRTWRALLGIDEQFTRGDKRLAVALFIWSMLWFAVFVVVTVWNLIRVWPDSWWANYWLIAGIGLPIVLGAVTSAWFTIGGVRDLRDMFRALRVLHANPADDGEIDVPEGKPAIPSPPVLAAEQ